MFTALFLTAFVAGWCLCGAAPWLVVSVVTRGHAGLATLPLTLLAAIGGGIAVPVLVRDDAVGLVASFVVAGTASTLLLGIRHLAFAPESRLSRLPHTPKETR